VTSSGREDETAQFVVRHLDDDVAARLKRRANRHGRSMEDEVRHILRTAVKDDGRAVLNPDMTICL
jgi:plasmid stability protein